MSLSLSLFYLSLSASSAHAADPLWPAAQLTTPELRLTSHPLTGLLESLASAALSRCAPDADNALIRIAVAPVELSAGGGITTEEHPELERGLTLALRAMVGAQAHTIALPQGDLNALWRHWRAQSARHDLPLTLARAVSLGRTLGARYLLLSRLTRDEGSLAWETKTVSVKQQRVVHTARYPLTEGALKAFSEATLKRSRRLDGVWRSALVPGWGQLEQGRPSAALAYGAGATFLTLAALTSTFQGLSAQSSYEEGTPDAVPYRAQANRAFTRANYLWAGLGALWLTSTLDAYMSGRDEVRLRFHFDPSGAVGLSGAF